MSSFRRVLVANRGEIAVRIIRAIHDLGAEAVAVFSEADRDALHVRLADYAYPIGPAPAAQSYLNGEAVLEAARKSSAEAVHPGYGFLSENARFARACVEAGIVFVGPSPEAMALMGDKVSARQLAANVGVPTVPGTAEPVRDAAAVEAARVIGYPLLIKAAAGGGGKGMRAVQSEADLLASLTQARSEAASSFGDGSVYLEKLVERPRHIEVQLFGDGAGRVVHLGERECSIQRRYQKVVEESPAPTLPDDVRERLCWAAVTAAAAAKYGGAGTIEFLYEPSTRNFYFLEMNARLQVEHPVTELVTGVDLVQAQLRLAAGESLEEALGTEEEGQHSSFVLRPSSLHAIQVRVMAEDPFQQWFPSTGTLDLLREPGGIGIRMDSACEPGMHVGVDYDPLLAKLIAWGRTRDEAVSRLRRALDEYVLTGVRTSLPFHRWLVRDPAFLAGDFSTAFIAERWRPNSAVPESSWSGATHRQAAALGAAEHTSVERRRQVAGSAAPKEHGWRRLARLESLR
ncbi:MAG TPA: biotin carboxylase N-terminal domain-containing protein [Chloroflexota bacterium]|nr:biotin carboxylase N-terminal domain-containing protein [Chloroflexota bacterium]